jgi:hypothetical protein
VSEPGPIKTCPCGDLFVPKAKGYNAIYCSGTCKNKEHRRRRGVTGLEQASKRRRYVRIKEDPARLAKHRRQGRNSAEKTRNWLAGYKVTRGCKDCGYRAHFAALQLDHLGPKTLAIADARSSISRLKDEIRRGRCVVVCANCHAVRTWRRKQRARKP